MTSPLRRLMENPDKLLAPLVSPGMTVLEPGPGMGFFTLPLARMVGPSGRVIAVDLSEKMLQVLGQRAAKAGVPDVIQTRVCAPDSLGLEDLQGQVDLCLAIHVVHELPDQEAFFGEAAACLKPGGRLLVMEPKMHVSKGDFAASLERARAVGFELAEREGYRAVLIKS